MKKRPFFYALPSLLIGMQAFAQINLNPIDQIDDIIAKANTKAAPELCASIDDKLEDSMRTTTNSLWKRVLRDLNEGSLRTKVVNGSYTANNFNLGLNYSVMSRYYAPGVHAGTDQFEFSLGLAYPFASEISASIGLSERRVVSYTRLYDTKCLSIVRLPYNPIKRLPVTAEKALNLTEGELVTFSAPFTISLGVGAETESVKANVGAFRSADVEVNVFKMQGKHVRLKLIAKKEKGVNFQIRVGADILSLPLRILKIEGSSAKSDLNLMDYIFDLSDAKAKEVYESIVAPKSILTFDVNDEKTKALTALLGNSHNVKSMLLDVAEIYKNAKDNKNIIRVLGSEAEIANSSSGFSVNLLNVAKLENRSNYSDSDTKVMSEDQKVLHTFFSRSIETIQTGKFFSLSAKDKYQMGTIFTQNNGEPLGFLLQRHTNRQDLSEYSKRRWTYNLTNSQLSSHYPNIAEKLTEIQKGGKLLTREMFFVDAEKFFSLNKDISVHGVKSSLMNLLTNLAKNNMIPTSSPSGEWPYDATNKLQEQHRSFLTYPDAYFKLSLEDKMKELTWMYGHELNTVIPQHLVKISDTSLDRDERRLAFNALMQTPLFVEIGIQLLSSLIPADQLKDVVIYELLLQPRNDSIEPMYITYGNTAGKNYITSQNAILTRNFSLEPGSNLRVYLKQDGKLKTVKEVLDEVKLATK